MCWVISAFTDVTLKGVKMKLRSFNQSLCGIDNFGRSFMPVDGWDEQKKVGVFYFLWHGQDEKMSKTYNITKLLREHPDDLWNIQGTEISPINRFYYWDEPIFGYYQSRDKWVISRHIELLIAAGVDFLFLDVTNAYTYDQSCEALLEVILEYIKEGRAAPKVMFYTNSHSIATIKKVYERFYTNEKYDAVWYSPNGRPAIVGNATVESDMAEAALRNDSYTTDELPEHIKNFFDIRPSQWPFDPVKPDGFPWMEWIYPQPNHNGIMNVSLAQHPHIPFSDSVKDRTRNMGRGYDFVNKVNVEQDARKGTNAQSQWDTVLNDNSVHTVTVTGWNEWVAIKLILENRVFFVDTMNEEFSRDIEPQKGDGYQDAFYLQLCDNIRRFKGVRDDQNVHNAGRAEYTAITKTAVGRDCNSVCNTVRYYQAPPRNNIQRVLVENCDDVLQFCIQNDDPFVNADAADFCNLFIGADTPKLQGWESYSFVAVPSEGKLYKLNKSGERTFVCDIKVNVEVDKLTVSIPVKELNAQNGVYFKVTDGFSSNDIMDSYSDGKCMPMGRLSWYYKFYK